MPYDFDLICIGSGPAGQRAAIQAAKLGKRAAVVEKRREVGGVCIDTGTIPSKTLREAVIGIVHESRGPFAERNGIRDQSPITAERLLRRVDETVRREQEVVEDQLCRNGVTILSGQGRFVDAHTIGVNRERTEQTYTTEFALVAVGTNPAVPPGVTVDGEVVMTSDDVIKLKTIPKSMAVIGGGVIGIEYASMFGQLGIDVTVIERRDRPLEFVDNEIVVELAHQLRDRGVSFRLGETVASVTVEGRRAVIQLESGKRVAVDIALYSAGRAAATEGLGLEAIGVTVGERGKIIVDAAFRTVVPNVFAAGDVIGAPSLAATSAEQGRLAARAAFGVSTGPMPSHFPYGIYSIPEISMVGPTERELTAAKVPYETGVARYREIARGQILGDDSGYFKMLFHAETRALLGVHVMGTYATELVHIGQAVLALGGGLDYFLETVFNYPTLAECYKVAALNAANKLQS
ncbi:MAG TPA: Si-specific NAD(P)(+) transhydrogenase [Candidatus Polarisedimenticolaceae bacterium]|nr:Si-specific NAD(P)(+) transhydrogenase [Candidatus Polarisedimenticolaceae bacterium]